MWKTFKLVGLALLVLLAGVLVWGWQSDRDAEQMKAKYGSASSRFIDIGNGLKIHTRDEGNPKGPVLLLVHGSNSSLHTWEPWVERLGGDYRIISIDLPGHGLTGANPTRDYHYASFVAVVDKLMTAIQVPKFAIAGNSMGGGVAWQYALKHPDRVTAIGLIDAAGAPRWEATTVPIGFRLARTPVIKDVMRYITPRSVVASSLKSSVSKKEIVTDAMIDRYWELLLFPGNRQATIDRFALRHNVEPASKLSLAAIRAPTLVMWGEEDGLIPVSSAQWFVSAIKDAKLVIYPGVGHIPMEEIPGQSAADMKAFLDAALVKPETSEASAGQ
jgi:pimeloyl-ACP methyl ester carboxylesterase